MGLMASPLKLLRRSPHSARKPPPSPPVRADSPPLPGAARLSTGATSPIAGDERFHADSLHEWALAAMDASSPESSPTTRRGLGRTPPPPSPSTVADTIPPSAAPAMPPLPEDAATAAEGALPTTQAPPPVAERAPPKLLPAETSQAHPPAPVALSAPAPAPSPRAPLAKAALQTAGAAAPGASSARWGPFAGALLLGLAPILAAMAQLHSEQRGELLCAGAAGVAVGLVGLAMRARAPSKPAPSAAPTPDRHEGPVLVEF
jgi:hypothetical protein